MERVCASNTIGAVQDDISNNAKVTQSMTNDNESRALACAAARGQST